MNSPLLDSASWQAAVSSGGGVVKVPPRPRPPPRDDRLGGVAPQPASSNVASDAATAPALCKKDRRSMCNRRAAASIDERIMALVARSAALGADGTNSPLETGPASS